jgi:hypothetical protein
MDIGASQRSAWARDATCGFVPRGGSGAQASTERVVGQFLTQLRAHDTLLDFYQFIEGRRWWTYARQGIEETRLSTGDGLGNGEEIRSASASVDTRQSVIN